VVRLAAVAVVLADQVVAVVLVVVKAEEVTAGTADPDQLHHFQVHQ